MIQALRNLFGMGPRVIMDELIANGAQVNDVRSRSEYARGHLKGSINIPLDQLHEHLKKLKSPDHPIITCCASGMRSGSAKNFLKMRGFTNVHNGGAWQNLKQYCK
jgi:phage shock protein E